jgi:cytochrome c peroxidase
MSRSLAAAALSASLLALAQGCEDPQPAPSPPPSASAAAAISAAPTGSAAAPAADRPKLATHEGGALVRDPSNEALYLADEDHGVVRRIPLPLALPIPKPDAGAAPAPSASAEAPAIHAPLTPPVVLTVPGHPAQVLPLGDKILVTVRDPGLLLVLSAGPDMREIGRVEVPDDAWGLALSTDEKTAFVSSAWTHQISAVDLATMKLEWSVSVPREPRGMVARADGTALYVTHLVGSALTRIDDLAGPSPRISPVALPPDPSRTRYREKLDAALGYAAVISPDGLRLYVARHALGGLTESAWFGTSTVDVLSTPNDTPALGPRGLPALGTLTTSELSNGDWKVDAAGSVAGAGWASQFPQPRAMVYRKSADTLLVASEGGGTLLEMDAQALAPALAPRQFSLEGSPPATPNKLFQGKTCGAPTGIALSRDELVAWVYCRTTNDIVTVVLDEPNGFANPREPAPPVHLADDPSTPDIATGRRLFYDATDSVVSGGLGCAGCHPEGRDDGHVWHELKHGPYSSGPIFVAGLSLLGDGSAIGAKDDPVGGFARQTPMLAARVAAPGPYGWHGESADLVGRLKAGFSLHRWWSNLVDGKTMRERAEPLAAFVREGLVPPPRREHPLTPEEARGKELFTSTRTRCSTCHVPEKEYTDRSPTELRQLRPPINYSPDPDNAFKTPSLLYVSGTAPYFHDGSAATLEDLVDKNQDRMGRTVNLSTDERAALIAFLRTL